MRKIAFLIIFSLLTCMFSGCEVRTEGTDIAATTLPVYQFTSMLCQGTDLTVTRLVTESVSCLHDYSLTVKQVKAIEAARLVVISGAGLEDFMNHILEGKQIIDSSQGIAPLDGCHDHAHEGHSHGDHDHQVDPHIWLSAANAKIMAENICRGLCDAYPQLTHIFEVNLAELTGKLQALDAYGQQQLSSLSGQNLITFHDGFSYLAQAYDLTILAAVEEEAGSEVSSRKLIELIELLRAHHITAIFTETNGSDAAAGIIARETGVKRFALDMAMAGDDYFKAMYHNIDTLREALQ